MHKFTIFFLTLLSLLSFDLVAETKFSMDATIDQLNFKKPPQGVGRAGVLIYKSANINNNGIILNINNINNYFDSQIFVRPTFLGFTTQFGNYGFSILENNLINSIYQSELKNSKVILDDNQLNLSGELFTFVTKESNSQLKNFRIYCQGPSGIDFNSYPNGKPANTSTDLTGNCFNFLTINGTYLPNNQFATLVYQGKTDKNEKTVLKAQIKSFDLRKNKINAQLLLASSERNNSFLMNSSEINFQCGKDPDLKTLDFEKIKTACFNQLKVGPMKANLTDKEAKSNFNLDIKDLTIQDGIAYFSLNSGSLFGVNSSTIVDHLLLNCKKENKSDLFLITDVLKDCVTYSRISIDEIKNIKPDQKDSSIKKILISSANGTLIIQAEVKFLGFKSQIVIYGHTWVDEAKKQLTIAVTDTRLPLGINSVKLLIYFLKKHLISKDIVIRNSNLTIQF